jgi:hypothetical protein
MANTNQADIPTSPSSTSSPAQIDEAARRILRHCGLHFWVRGEDGSWSPYSYRLARDRLCIDLKIDSAKARALCAAIKSGRPPTDDVGWWRKVQWLKFTKGLALLYAFDRVHFCRHGDSKSVRSMPVAKFNRILAEQFPWHPPITDQTPALTYLIVDPQP